jgi:hypothetical protein
LGGNRAHRTRMKMIRVSFGKKNMSSARNSSETGGAKRSHASACKTLPGWTWARECRTDLKLWPRAVTRRRAGLPYCSCARHAEMKPLKSGCGALGLLLNSG